MLPFGIGFKTLHLISFYFVQLGNLTGFLNQQSLRPLPVKQRRARRERGTSTYCLWGQGQCALHFSFSKKYFWPLVSGSPYTAAKGARFNFFAWEGRMMKEEGNTLYEAPMLGR